MLYRHPQSLPLALRERVAGRVRAKNSCLGRVTHPNLLPQQNRQRRR